MTLPQGGLADRERERLINLLALTTSPHDGEALVAARKANELLRRLRLSWGDVILSRRTEQPEPPSGATETGSSWRYESWGPDGRPDHWGSGNRASYRAHPTPRRVAVAGKIRLFLSGIPILIRVALAPLSVAGYVSAWTLEASGVVELDRKAHRCCDRRRCGRFFLGERSAGTGSLSSDAPSRGIEKSWVTTRHYFGSRYSSRRRSPWPRYGSG